jgi:hypothetical protein
VSFLYGFLYFAPVFITGLVVYALWRNQRVAGKSPLVDRTNFMPRVAAIVEVVLHPDRAATWFRQNDKGEYVLVFPQLGKDSSEIYGHRPDDRRAS